MSGKYKINPLEPKAWNDGQDEIDKESLRATQDGVRQMYIDEFGSEWIDKINELAE